MPVSCRTDPAEVYGHLIAAEKPTSTDSRIGQDRASRRCHPRRTTESVGTKPRSSIRYEPMPPPATRASPEEGQGS